MQTQDFFAHLRSTLQQTPGATTWRAFVELTAQAPDDLAFIQQVALPYAHDHFRQWPQTLDATRIWPTGWLNALGQGATLPWGVLARRVDLRLAAPTRPSPRPLLSSLALFAPHITHLYLTGDHLGTQTPHSFDHFLQLNQNALCALHLHRVPGLQVHPIARILAQHDLSNLRWLALQHLGLNDASVETLANSTWLEQLHTLDLQNNSIGDTGVATLAQHPWRRLNTLLMLDNPIRGESFHALASAPSLTKLKRLSLGQTQLVYDGTWSNIHDALEAVWQCDTLPQLKSLTFHYPHFTLQSLAPVLNQPTLTSLEDLDLYPERPLSETEQHQWHQRSQHIGHRMLLNKTTQHLCREDVRAFEITTVDENTTQALNDFMDDLPFDD